MLRPKLNRLWAGDNSNLRRDPGDTKYSRGWVSEIPTFQVLNYLQYKVDSTLLANAERGIFEWGTDVQYKLGSLAWDETDGKIYVSTVGEPSRATKPSANPTQWAASSIQITRLDYDTVVSAITAHIADVTGNPHKLTAGRLDAYNKNQTDAILQQYLTEVKNHVDDKNNPHQTTAAAIGAVPAAGGTYSGDVTFEGSVFFNAAQKKKVNTTGGLFLESDAGQIGITDAGVPVAGPSGATSPLILEKNFAEFKRQNQNQYATPLPSFKANLIRDINMQIGSSSMTSNLDPGYDSATGAICLDNLNSFAVTTDENMMQGATNFTIAFDIMSTTPRIQNDSTPSLYFSTGSSMSIIFSGSSLITVAYIGGFSTSYQLTGPVGTWYRIVGSAEGSKLNLYVNGLIVASTDITPVAATNTKFAMQTIQKPSLNSIWYFRNWRVWAQGLTNKQISTL